MSASCQYCAGTHADAAQTRYCRAVYLVVTQLGGTVVDVGPEDMRHAERVEAQVRREERQRAAGLARRGGPRQRKTVSVEERVETGARPLMAPVPSPARQSRGRPVVKGPSVDRWRGTGRPA